MSHKRQKGAFLNSVGVLYAVLLTVMGVVLPLTAILPRLYGPSTTYLSIFYCYTYGLAIIIFIYLNTYLIRYKRSKLNRADGAKADERSEPKSNPGSKLNGLKSKWHQYRKVNEKNPKCLDQKVPLKPPDDDNANPECRLNKRLVHRSKKDNHDMVEMGSQTDVAWGCEEEERLPFTYNAEGVNFFLLLGLLGFGMGGIANDSFQLSQFFEKDETWECYTSWYILQTCFRLIFIIIQAHFLFKNHKLVINFHRPLVRLALIHLMATNIVDWSYTVTLEATESFLHAMHDPDDHGEDTASKVKATTPMTPTLNHTHLHGNSTYDPEKDISSFYNYNGVSQHGETYHMTFETCLSPMTLALKLAPYLYPCLIEYSLLSAAMLYRLYSTIGIHIEEEVHVIRKHNSATCDKATTGLFAGLVVFVTVSVSVCFFEFYFTTHPLENPITVHLYYISDSLIHILATIALAMAFAKMTHLHFCPHSENALDRNLILVALAGHYTMAIAMLLPPFMSIHHPAELMRMFAVYGIIYGFLTIAQVTLQVAFMLDAAQRRAIELEDYEKKPGRSTVTFLILINLAMWVVNTFELKAAPYSLVHREYYGLLPWIIIMHLCLPLTIFFRFHSSIMLADIWLETYSSKNVRALIEHGHHHPHDIPVIKTEEVGV